eukprot:3761151-Alexandrium_andersonii.AAC.1
MASSYWCLRCHKLPRHCGCPRAAAHVAAGQQRREGGGGNRQATLDRWFRGQRAQGTSQQAVPVQPQRSGGEPRFSMSCP